MNDPNHPAWKLLRQMFVCTVILITFELCYDHGLVWKDVLPIISIMLSIFGYDHFQTVMTATPKDSP